MAKNIYRKYKAVEIFQYQKIKHGVDYYKNYKDYGLKDNKYFWVYGFFNTGSVENYARDYKINQRTNQFDLFNIDSRLSDNPRVVYVNFDSLERKDRNEYVTLASGKTGYESGRHILEYIIPPNGKSDRPTLLAGYELERKSAGFKRGSYIGEVEAEEGTYPLEQNYNGYWYEYDRPANYPPQISGSDYDMGSKTENFDIEYYVTDRNNDSINVKILLDDIQKETKSVFNNQKHIYNVNIQDLNLGSHTVKIIATDRFGATDTRTYTFYKSNTAPIISGRDEDLGGKSLGFTINYDITDPDGDEVDVTISLNDEELSNITTTSKNGLTFTLNDDKVKALTIGDKYTITIKVDDRKGGIAYRRYTFTKTNSVPVISGNNKDLGEKSETFSHTFSVTDYEKDPIAFRVKLDNKVIKEVEKASDGKKYTAEISHEDFIRLSYGEHKITIEAWDNINKDKIQKRVLTFTRVSSGLDVEIKVTTSKVQPKKIIAVPHGIFAPDATLQVLVCNNYLDAEPTWEEATEMSNLARAYAFENTAKEGDEWAIGIKVLITDGESGEVSILKGVKGGFE